jgi:hypothetical protein
MLSTPEIVAIILAFLGFVGTTSMLIMNLRVTGAVKDLESHFLRDLSKVELSIEKSSSQSKEQIAGLKLDLANMRTRLAEDTAAQYQRIMTNMEAGFASKQLALEQHASNTKRLDLIEGRLLGVEERLPV